MRRADRRGFTLIELMAALALTGIVLAGAQSLLSQLVDARERSRADLTRSARDANGAALLRDVVFRAETSMDSAESLAGDKGSVAFRSRCDVPAGWQEECRVTLAIDRDRDGASLALEIPPASVVVMRLSRDAELRYVDADRQWRSSWRREMRPPLAIAITDRRDTLIFPIGARP